ncbi:MAG: ParB N-terminal domain-containing protein [Chitinophagaceae bacterium]|nr:ParB N-terminal domain-containing protein [Chitinophagaceae bacterium]
MKRKLKINKHFTPCPIDDEDEMYPNGIFIFNITKMAEYIRNNNITCEEVLVKEFSRGSSKFKESHLATVDVTRPIIVAEISPGRYNVIDGNHRMEQARRIGIETLPAYKISPDQHLQFLTTEQGYLAYIEYWNSKLKELLKRSKSC